MNQRERDLRALIRQMTVGELNEAIGLLQAEMKKRNETRPPIGHDWKHRITR